MNDRAATFDAICAAYAITRKGPARQVSERVWHLSTDDGEIAAKLYTNEQHARATKEAAVLAHLHAHDDARFRVQTLRRTTDGDALWIGLDSHAMLTQWETGQFKTYDTFTPDQWAALGASLAALHLSLDRLHLPALDTLHARLSAFDVDHVRNSLTDALDRAPPDTDTSHLRTYVDTSLRLIDQHYPGSIDAFPVDDPQHPIHNDYNQFNYLFDADCGLPPVILDWEAVIGAPREFELVRCLNHLPLEAPALAEVFVRAYRQVRPVRVERIAWAVDAACLQHALKLWVVQGWLADPPRFDAHLRGAATMASTMAGARGQLIDFFSRCVEAGS